MGALLYHLPSDFQSVEIQSCFLSTAALNGKLPIMEEGSINIYQETAPSGAKDSFSLEQLLGETQTGVDFSLASNFLHPCM